uniref:Uncharacterized protein n=1 Tax=Echinococcus granulosus TaxID=6210 RepID=U6FVN7_ECHGR|nr:hypothetical protein EgrG_000336200 [Echinococcus granulosus]
MWKGNFIQMHSHSDCHSMLHCGVVAERHPMLLGKGVRNSNGRIANDVHPLHLP